MPRVARVSWNEVAEERLVSITLHISAYIWQVLTQICLFPSSVALLSSHYPETVYRDFHGRGGKGTDVREAPS